LAPCLVEKSISLDDIIIPAKDEEEAVSNLNKVISTCSEYGLELNLNKCHFTQTHIQFLNHIIENITISPTPKKIDENLRQLESVLGLRGYLRKFIQKYALISKPFTDLTKN